MTGVAASALPAAPKVLWTYDAGDAIDSSAAIANGIVYVGLGKGDLIAVDFAAGQKRFEFDAGGPITASPAVAAGRLVIGTTEGVLYCFG